MIRVSLQMTYKYKIRNNTKDELTVRTLRKNSEPPCGLHVRTASRDAVRNTCSP